MESPRIWSGRRKTLANAISTFDLQMIPERYRELIARLEDKLKHAAAVAAELPQNLFSSYSDEEIVAEIEGEIQGGWRLREKAHGLLINLFAGAELPKPPDDPI
jgi:hypothetical protein